MILLFALTAFLLLLTFFWLYNGIGIRSDALSDATAKAYAYNMGIIHQKSIEFTKTHPAPLDCVSGIARVKELPINDPKIKPIIAWKNYQIYSFVNGQCLINVLTFYDVVDANGNQIGELTSGNLAAELAKLTHNSHSLSGLVGTTGVFYHIGSPANNSSENWNVIMMPHSNAVPMNNFTPSLGSIGLHRGDVALLSEVK